MERINIYHSGSWNELEEIRVMRRKNNSSARSMDFFQEIHNHDDIFLIEISCWFISEESSGLMDKCPGNGNPLCLTS